MEVNVKGPMFLTQLAMKSMRERNEGVIIIISSNAAIFSRGQLLLPIPRPPKFDGRGISWTVRVLHVQVRPCFCIEWMDGSRLRLAEQLLFAPWDVCNSNSMRRASRACTCTLSTQVSFLVLFSFPFPSEQNEQRQREDGDPPIRARRKR